MLIIIIWMKTIYSLQPFEIGSKNGESLVMTIPVSVKKECNIDTSSIFCLKVNEKIKQIIVYGPTNQLLNFPEIESKNDLEIPADKLVEESEQQVSSF